MDRTNREAREEAFNVVEMAEARERLRLASASDPRIVLAHERPVRLGPLLIEPMHRRIAHDDGREDIVEPRVMQVLVALLRARGGIVSRDDFIRCCWDGRIVGEDAINRVLSRLRRTAQGVGAGVFRIETLTKVGYRLVPDRDFEPVPAGEGEAADASPAPARKSRRRWLNRRTALIGGGALAIAAPALWFTRDRWLGASGHVPNAEARRSYDWGMRAQYHGLTDTSYQAEAYFRRATELDPEWADAWGSLAMSYRHLLDGETNEDQWRLVQQTRSAARRALALEPDNAEALVALELIPAPYRRWGEAERGYRALLERFPNSFVLRGHLNQLLMDVGRCGDAAEQSRIAVEQQPMVNGSSVRHAWSLWGAGRLQEAEAETERGIRTWPRHQGIWFTRMTFLTYTGKTDAAIALASDRNGRPPNMPDFLFERRIVLARAVATRAPADITAATAQIETFIQRSLGQEPHVVGIDPVNFFATIGDLDMAFGLLEGWFFARGRFASPARRPAGPLTRRESHLLFMPMTASLRSDRRFQPLVEEIGLEAYWRQTGATPDFRRQA
jgi:DNA-binding winged helix-turn-helix (wHTH) protein